MTYQYLKSSINIISTKTIQLKNSKKIYIIKTDNQGIKYRKLKNGSIWVAYPTNICPNMENIYSNHYLTQAKGTTLYKAYKNLMLKMGIK